MTKKYFTIGPVIQTLERPYRTKEKMAKALLHEYNFNECDVVVQEIASAVKVESYQGIDLYYVSDTDYYFFVLSQRQVELNSVALSKDGRSLDIRVVTTIDDSGIGCHITGLSDKNVKECALRVSSAMTSCKYKFPSGKIVINVINATDNSEIYYANSLDAVIAFSLLVLSGQTDCIMRPKIILPFTVAGELSLYGRMLSIPREIDFCKECFILAILPKEDNDVHREKFSQFLVPRACYEVDDLNQLAEMAGPNISKYQAF